MCSPPPLINPHPTPSRPTPFRPPSGVRLAPSPSRPETPPLRTFRLFNAFNAVARANLPWISSRCHHHAHRRFRLPSQSPRRATRLSPLASTPLPNPLSIRCIRGCVSGSPSRTLNSRTFGPGVGHHQTRIEEPVNPVSTITVRSPFASPFRNRPRREFVRRSTLPCLQCSGRYRRPPQFCGPESLRAATPSFRRTAR